MIDAHKGKEHGLSPAMTKEMFWAWRRLRQHATAWHFVYNGENTATLRALERRKLLLATRHNGRVFSEKGELLAERMFG